MNTRMTRRKKIQNNLLEGRPSIFAFLILSAFRHLTCFLMNALILVMRNSFSCNTQQIISFSFQSYSLLVMAFHRYFFPNGSDFFTTMGDSFCCIPIICTVCCFLSYKCYRSAVIYLTPWYGMLISCSGTL